MPTDTAQLLRDTYEAFGRGDVATVMEAFADDIEWNAPEVLPHGGAVTGKEAVGGFFQGLAETWDDFGLEVADITAAGDRAYASGHAGGTYDGQPAGYGFVHAWTIRDGVCARFDEYVDPSPELIAAAAAASAPAR
jgi:uncharacterized protein